MALSFSTGPRRGRTPSSKCPEMTSPSPSTAWPSAGTFFEMSGDDVTIPIHGLAICRYDEGTVYYSYVMPRGRCRTTRLRHGRAGDEESLCTVRRVEGDVDEGLTSKGITHRTTVFNVQLILGPGCQAEPGPSDVVHDRFPQTRYPHEGRGLRRRSDERRPAPVRRHGTAESAHRDHADALRYPPDPADLVCERASDPPEASTGSG